MRKKFISVFAAFSIVITMLVPLGITANAEVPTDVDMIYNSDNSWEGSLVIDEDKTIKLSSVVHAVDGTDGSPVVVTNGATLTLVYEGVNTLTGNENYIGAGIRVDEGSTLNLYGADDSAVLTVTGGKYGAGIGGQGYGSASTGNAKSGNINIYSGNITATGGNRGAGIGSGYHSSAGNINIYGGDIKAFGVGCSAGIGSGYGTSGGVSEAALIGYYNGGNITISGGRVFASSYVVDPAQVNIYSPESMFAAVTSGDQFAAGIGGGYGASSGVININGDADVTAIGWNGGAGIGTGRGTSKPTYFDANNAFCDTTIGGNAKVTALAGGDYRTSIVGNDGAAAIGLSRGFAIEDTEMGTITITDNASVYAYGSPNANAIGTSSCAGKYSSDNDNVTRPAHAQLSSLTIGKNCSITAVSTGVYAPVYGTNNDDKFTTIQNSAYRTQYISEAHDEQFESQFALYNADTNTAIDCDFMVPFSTADEQAVSIKIPADNTNLLLKDAGCNILSSGGNTAFEKGSTYNMDALVQHIYTDEVKAPSCTDGGYTTHTCVFCNYAFNDTETGALGHDFAKKWSFDKTNHWHKCSRCNVISAKAAHTWDKGVVTKKATPTATGTKKYTCTVCGATKTATIKKCAKYKNPLMVKGKTKTVKLSAVKNKNLTVARKNAITVSKAKGKVTYAKKSGSKNITVKKKTGKITVKKGTKKGTYTIKVTVTAAGNKTYKKGAKTVKVTIIVK